MHVKSIAEHSAVLSTCIKLPPVFKTFFLSIFEWQLKTGWTVLRIFHLLGEQIHKSVSKTIVSQHEACRLSSAFC